MAKHRAQTTGPTPPRTAYDTMQIAVPGFGDVARSAARAAREARGPDDLGLLDDEDLVRDDRVQGLSGREARPQPGAHMAQALLAALNAAYDALPQIDGAQRVIYPFVGAAFTTAEGTALRMMAIGVNAYGEGHHVHDPGRWAQGFRQQEWRYQRHVLADLGALATGLSNSAVTGAHPFLGMESVYLTNAVKRWLPDARQAHTVAEEWFGEGEPVLDAELAALDKVGRLPHVVVVVGQRPWSYVWPAFTPTRSRWSVSYLPTSPSDRLFHHLNLVQVREGGTTRPLLLLRIRHSSASHWKRGWIPARLLAEPTFRRVAGLADGPTLEPGGHENGA